MDLTSLRRRFRDYLQPSNASAAINSAFAAIKILYVRAWRRWNKPGFKSGLFRTTFWALLATMYGLFVGAATVMLPPMAPIALVAISAPILFWALPDLPSIPAESLKRAFFAAVIVEISIPTYYMVQISGIPWISIRRVAIITLVLLTLYSISVSRKERQTISSLLSGQYWLSVCVIGFLCMAFTSIFFTSSPTLSITQFVEMLLNWYLPFFACLLVVGSERNLIVLYKTVAVLSLFVAALGVLDFITRHNWAVEIIPTPLLMKMIQDNPSVADIVYANPIRNGSYRASSIYNVPLSYGEFACMIAPIGLYFIFHARKASEFALGILVLVGSMLSIYVSGSRGASVAFLISAPLFVGLWVIRYSASHPRSTVGPLFATAAGMAVAGLFAVIFTSKKVSNVVFGGGDTRASNDARQEQWLLGWPHIVENPLTGHGFGTAADVVGYYTPANALTIDSYALSLLVETGVPGFVFYFGAIAIAAILLIRVYLTDKDRGAEISAPVACSLIAYGFYRIALSQRENQTLFFIFLATAFVITRESAKRFAKKTKTVERAIDTR